MHFWEIVNFISLPEYLFYQLARVVLILIHFGSGAARIRNDLLSGSWYEPGQKFRIRIHNTSLSDYFPICRYKFDAIGNWSSRISDPYSFFTDPDPDPVDPDGGQYGSGYGSGSNPDPDPIRIQGFNDQKLKKNKSWKKKFNFFLIKNCNLPIPRPP